MPFNHLLFEALLPGKTLADDRKHGGTSSVRLEPAAGETVLLFRLDSEKTKDRLGLVDKSCCDYLYLYRTKDTSLLIFIELKGENLDRSAQQLSSAIQSVCSHSGLNGTWRRLARAVIVSSTVSPKERTKLHKQMKEQGIRVYFGTSRKSHARDIKRIEGLNEDFRTS